MGTKKKGQQADSSKDTSPHADGANAREPEAGAAKKESQKNSAAAVKAEKAQKSQPKPQSKKKDDEGVGEGIKDLRQFLREVRIEFYKITWPERPQVLRETYSVLVLVALITVMVLAFDWFLGSAIFGPLEHFARMHGGGIGRG